VLADPLTAREMPSEAVSAPSSAPVLPSSGLSRREPEGRLGARPTALLASLAYTDQIDTRKPALTCPYGSGRVTLELFSGKTYPDRCRASRCHVCLPLNARRRTLAITLCRPRRMIRLSMVAESGDDTPHRTALTRVQRTRQALKRMGLEPGEWCFTIEENPQETGFHIHCLQTGGYIEQGALQEACARAGAGIPYINAIKRQGTWVNQYGLKGFGADGYGLKQFRPRGDPMRALQINGGRVEHHSRGFYDIDGVNVRVRLAERRAIAELNAGKPIAFINVAPEEASGIMEDLPLRRRLITDVLSRSAYPDRSSPLLCHAERLRKHVGA
jgi:hypothetical protein